MAQEGKENASAALGLGRISADLRAGHGATPQPGQQLSCPGDLLCCVLRFPVCANGCVYRCKVGAGGLSEFGVQNKTVFLLLKSSNIT